LAAFHLFRRLDSLAVILISHFDGMVFLAILSVVQIGKLLEQTGALIRGVLGAWQILGKHIDSNVDSDWTGAPWPGKELRPWTKLNMLVWISPLVSHMGKTGAAGSVTS
jgi:hypothetical protein